jgi:hypothetical protein
LPRRAFELAPDRGLARPASGYPWLARLASNSKAPLFFLLHEGSQRKLDQPRKISLWQAMTRDRACPLDQVAQLDICREMRAKAIGGQRFELAPTHWAGEQWMAPRGRSSFRCRAASALSAARLRARDQVPATRWSRPRSSAR